MFALTALAQTALEYWTRQRNGCFAFPARTPQARDFGREYDGQRNSDWDLAKVRAVKFKFNLKPHSSVYAPLQFSWNETRGEVSGPGAELVRNNATAALKFGHIAIHPIDCTVNPLTSRALLAAMLSYDYQLPKVLADVLATAPDEQDSGEFEGVEFIVVDDSEITF